MSVFWPHDVGVGAVWITVACLDIYKLAVVKIAFKLIKQGNQLGIESQVEFCLQGVDCRCGNDSGEGCTADPKPSITTKHCLKRFGMATDNGLPNLGQH